MAISSPRGRLCSYLCIHVGKTKHVADDVLRVSSMLRYHFQDVPDDVAYLLFDKVNLCISTAPSGIFQAFAGHFSSFSYCKSPDLDAQIDSHQKMELFFHYAVNYAYEVVT